MDQKEKDTNDLIKACLKHDQSAQFQLYKQYSNAMYSTTVRMLGNTADAEDALQDAFVNAFKNYQPKEYALFKNGISCYNTKDEKAFIDKNYVLAENISIDYAILENSDQIFVQPATFDWNDLGTWGSLHQKLDKDEHNNATVNGRLLARNATGNMVRTSKNKIVVLDNLNDYIVVDKEDVLLICPKTSEQDIKIILNEVKEKFKK